jgi:uncharacterized SAM-binding protein YcdF (DUF218 family)
MDIFVWKQLLKNLVLPPAGPLLAALVGLLLRRGERTRKAGTVLCVAALAVLWLVATPLVADALERLAQGYPPLDLAKPVRAQAVVILAGGVRVDAPEYGTSAPSPTTLARVLYGARVARATALPVLVSGSRYEAQSMDYMLRTDLGITPRWIENRSRDTRQNAQMSAAILLKDGVRSVVLVTSAAHMRRAVREFAEAGLEPVAAPTELWTRAERGVIAFVPSAGALSRSQRALYEALGLAVRALGLGRARTPVNSAAPSSASSPPTVPPAA